MTTDEKYEQYKKLEQEVRVAIEEGLIEAKGLNRSAQANFCTQRVMDCLERKLAITSTLETL